MTDARRVRVLIVDDSAVVRRLLAEGLARDPGIEVLGTAPDPFVARDRIVEMKPDVVTLDIEMPRMDGLTFLKKLMTHYPLPVVILSSISSEGGKVALRALEIGAVDVIAKPSVWTEGGLEASLKEIADKIKSAAGARIGRSRATAAPVVPVTASLPATNRVIALGASTGGTEALADIFARLPATAPATLVVQHMPASFIGHFAERLDGLSAMEVRAAKHGETLRDGLALMAPGGTHMILRTTGARRFVELTDGPLVCHQKPAVDVLFTSVARTSGKNAVGVLLTGMGSDGAAGLLEMRNAGARTIAQDEATCVVYGMPRAAVERGAAEFVVPLPEISALALQLAAERST